MAILLVIGCHSALPHMALAGEVGVTVFFVLSGFLITSLLLEHDRVDFAGFWARRARRLLPALVVMMLVLFPAFWLQGMTAAAYWHEAIPGLLYFANYHELVHGWTMPFGHLWSLSVEEQFYVVFPVLVAALRCRPRAILCCAVFAGLASGVARVALSLNPATTMRGYFGVDTNAFALLLGVAIAATMALGWVPKLPRIAAFVGGVLVFGSGFAPYFGAYNAIAVPAALGTGILIVASLGSSAGPILSWGPLRSVGRVSYGWYLWQGPLLALTWPTTEPGHPVEKLVVCLLALGVAAVSWRYLERPVQRWTPGRATVVTTTAAPGPVAAP